VDVKYFAFFGLESASGAIRNPHLSTVRSTASRTCVMTQLFSTFGDRAFSVASSGLWNSLPSHLKDADLSYRKFRQLLTTFLFGQWGHDAVWTLLTALTRNIRTYLLYLLT